MKFKFWSDTNFAHAKEAFEWNYPSNKLKIDLYERTIETSGDAPSHKLLGLVKDYGGEEVK